MARHNYLVAMKDTSTNIVGPVEFLLMIAPLTPFITNRHGQDSVEQWLAPLTPFKIDRLRSLEFRLI